MAVTQNAATSRATFTRGRRVAIGINVLIASLLAPLVGGLLLYLAFRPELRRRFDLTSRGAFTLSDRTLRTLEGLKSPVDVYTCFRPIPFNDAGLPSPGFDAIVQTIALHCNDLLREFEVRGGGKLRTHFYDPNFTGHLTRIAELKAQIGEAPQNVVVVASGSRLRVLKLPDLAAYDAGTQTSQAMSRPMLYGFRDEEAIVQAILSVTEEHEVRVGFLRGHGERDPGAMGFDASGRGGLSRFKDGLVAQNYALRAIELSADSAFTKADVDVLVIADPVRAIPPGEVEAIVRYARGGGALALLLGPEASNSLDFPLLNEVLGLVRHPNPVCEVQTFGNLTNAPDVFYTDERSCSDHAIVKPLKSRRMRMVWKDVVAFETTGRAEESGTGREPLVWTGKDAWEDLPDGEHRYNHSFDPGVEAKNGPYVLAYAVTSKDAGRAVVVGTADLLDDVNLMGAPGNRDFGLNLVDWLAQREQLISIAAKPFDTVVVDLTPKEFNTIFLYVVAGVPAVALLLGIAVFWMRRN